MAQINLTPSGAPPFGSDPQPNTPAELKGTVETVIFKNEESDFKIFTIVPDQGSKKPLYSPVVTVTGIAPGVEEDLPVSVKGTWIQHNRYGLQVQLQVCEVIRPATKRGIINYISSGMIKGLGKTLAERIVAEFGEKTYEVLDNEPEKLLGIEGIGKKNLKRITKSWKEQHAGRMLARFLAEYDIPVSRANRIYKKLGDKAEELIRENPYCLEELVEGIGFTQADEIAQKLGVTADSPFRIQSCIKYVMSSQSKSGGHTCYNPEYIAQMALNQLKSITPPDGPQFDIQMVNNEILNMIENGKLILDMVPDGHGQIYQGLYLPVYGNAERSVAENMARIMYTSPIKEIDDKKWGKILEKLGELGIEYDQTQLDAIRQAVSYKICVLTGGPGTGKTTTTNGIITALKMMKKKILCAAPTGRAAKRMAEATDMAAVTIHRLLGCNGTDTWEYNKDNQLIGDVLIIDESSMIDLCLMQRLLEAIPSSMSLIIVGDVDQLPSVRAGNVLKDIIESKCYPVTKLTKIFRQAQNSLIITNAHKANAGQNLYMPPFGTPDVDFTLTQIENNDPQAALHTQNAIVQYVTKDLPQMYGVQPTDIQVLIPMHPGDAGVTAVNKAIQQALNPHGEPIKKIYAKKGENQESDDKQVIAELRVGDKVIQTSNDYEKEVFNGTVGYIQHYNKKEKLVYIMFDGATVEYELDELEDIKLAYAMTIHKSQGSEYPIVVMPMLKSYYTMLKRNLIYTGITRAKKKLVMIGQPYAIYKAVTTADSMVRYSMLHYRLRDQYAQHTAKQAH